MNNEIQLPYLNSSLDTLFDEDSSIYSHCFLLDHFLKNLTNYISTFKKGKNRRTFEGSNFILVKKKKNKVKDKNDNRQLSRIQLLPQCKNTYGNAFGLKDVWQVYYDPPKPRIMNALSLSSGLVMQFLRDVSIMDAHVLLTTTTSHCYLDSSFVGCMSKKIIVKLYWKMN
jgi:hypothetical protein